MTSIPMARLAPIVSVSGALVLAGTAFAVTALADWLFYLHTLGLSVPIFAAALCVAALLTNPVRAGATRSAAATAILAIALVPAIEDFGVSSLVFAVAGACVFVLMVTQWTRRPAVQRLTDVGWMAVSGPFRLAADLGSAVHEARRRDIPRRSANWLLAWIVPAGLGGLFLLLFAQANPLIERWLVSADTPHWQHLDLVRPLFWIAVVAVTWPFLRVRIAGKSLLQDIMEALEFELLPEGPCVRETTTDERPAPLQAATAPEEPAAAAPTAAAAPAEGPLFGRTAILRSLVLFNALFAVQSALDITYLWGGLALPAGMTYATYAHRGVYPLIVTALMAGGFVLAAMQPGSGIARCRLARALVFIWIGQTVLLVLSSMLRLDLYVEVYSLTEWRCAAFVWMLLVAAGLILIVARIVLDQTNRWLVWANAAALILALYVCSLIDFSGTIARFNVMHSREIAGAGQPVDMVYLCRLGPAALPALDVLARAKSDTNGWLPESSLYDCRPNLTLLHTARMADWRAWTFRGYRLNQYLDGDRGSLAQNPRSNAGGTPSLPGED